VTIYVDSSAWYAAIDRDDVDHTRAVVVLDTDEPKVSSDHVLLETWRLLAHRVGWTIADNFWQAMLGDAAHVEIVGRGDLDAALEVRQRFDDQSFSLADCTSFVVMERLRLDRVATYDDDFLIYRYGPRGDRAFHVVR
jgi:predicted nucleic acid-binding protein